LTEVLKGDDTYVDCVVVCGG